MILTQRTSVVFVGLTGCVRVVWVHETAVQGDGGVTLLAVLHYVAKNPKSLLQPLILQKNQKNNNAALMF